MKLYFMSRKKKIPIHIFQKSVGKGFSVIEKPAAVATTQISSLTDLDTVVHLIFSFSFVANIDVPCVHHFKPFTLECKLLKQHTHFHIISGHMLTSAVFVNYTPEKLVFRAWLLKRNLLFIIRAMSLTYWGSCKWKLMINFSTWYTRQEEIVHVNYWFPTQTNSLPCEKVPQLHWGGIRSLMLPLVGQNWQCPLASASFTRWCLWAAKATCDEERWCYQAGNHPGSPKASKISLSSSF